MSEKQYREYLITHALNTINSTYDYNNPKLRRVKEKLIKRIKGGN